MDSIHVQLREVPELNGNYRSRSGWTCPERPTIDQENMSRYEAYVIQT